MTHICLFVLSIDMDLYLIDDSLRAFLGLLFSLDLGAEVKDQRENKKNFDRCRDDGCLK